MHYELVDFIAEFYFFNLITPLVVRTVSDASHEEEADYRDFCWEGPGNEVVSVFWSAVLHSRTSTFGVHFESKVLHSPADFQERILQVLVLL